MQYDENDFSFETLSNTFKNLYKNDSTLDYLTKFEEDRKQLLGLSKNSLLFQEQAEEMKKLLINPILSNAFTTIEDYEKFINPMLTTINKHDYSALQSLATAPISSFLDNNYSSTLKATELLSNSIEKAKAIGLTESEFYNSQLSDSINKYINNDRLEATKNILGLSSSIDTDIFKSKIKGFDPANSVTSDFFNSNQIGTIKELKTVGKITPKIESIKLDIPLIPKIQDSPIYKQNERLIDKSNTQIELMSEMSSYMASQSEHLKIQNEIMSNQIEDNKSSSKIALWTAIFSLLIATVVSIGSGYLTYFVYVEEDKSDLKNHTELKTVIENNNDKNFLIELVEELKQQNKNLESINQKLNQKNLNYKKIVHKGK